MNGRASSAAVTALVCVIVSVSCGGESEATREAEAMTSATPNRVQVDGSIRLTDDDKAALGLEVQSATEAELSNAILRFGRVVSTPANAAQVVSPVTGRISRPPRVQLGQVVEAGAPVVDVQPSLDVPERISVGTQAAQRQGDIEAAQRELTKAEADAERARALSPQVVSAAQVQQAETAVATARARLEGLQAARSAETTERTQTVTVTAPMAGAIADLTTSVGALVNRGDVLARILRPGPLWVDVSVPPDEPVGDHYEVLSGTTVIPARFLTRGQLADAAGTRMDRLVVENSGAPPLTTGSTVSIRVGHGAARGIVVPESAIVPGVETDTVFVETSAGTYVARPVQVGARFGGRVRISTGLTVGDRVVVRGGMALEGELVRAQLRPAG